MAIPDYQTLMLPLLKQLSDGKVYSIKEAIAKVSQKLKLTEEEINALLPSGRKTYFYDRINWAKTYMKKAGLLKSEGRGIIQITDRGLKVLKQNPVKIDVKFLEQFEEFQEFMKLKTGKEKENIFLETIDSSKTPEELIELSFQQIEQALAQELLETVKKCSPAFFEYLVVDLITKMGYGGSLKDAGQAIGKTGDGGIDGIIKEDKLGLDTIYIQAKRWENSVPVKEIRDFAGALLGKKARKGIFITTSSFSPQAFDYIKSIEPRIILIDGEHLASFMIDHNIGVSTKRSLDIKKIDSDYFSEE